MNAWNPNGDTPADVISSRLSGAVVAAAVFALVVVACVLAPARPDAEDAAIRQNYAQGREAMR